MTKFVGTSNNGKKMNVENCSWYATNLRVILRTLASGLGPINTSSVSVHLGLPNLQSFSKQQFQRIELLIGKFLLQEAATSMQASLELEVEKTKMKVTGKQMTITQDSPLVLTCVGPSGNRYDSVSCHAFFIWCLTKKIVMAQITTLLIYPPY